MDEQVRCILNAENCIFLFKVQNSFSKFKLRDADVSLLGPANINLLDYGLQEL